MFSLVPFFQRVKPALDGFLKDATLENLKLLEKEVYSFNWMELKVVHVHILFPLVLKIEELSVDGKNQELRTAVLRSISLVISKVFLNDVKGLRTILAVVLKQLRNLDKAETLPNLSEEIKLAVVDCISEAFQHTTSDVLEEFYTTKSTSLLGHTLLLLVELIELERYRKLQLAALDCLMVVFYVHDKADAADVVLRSQVADTLFIYLPKVIGVLFKLATADDKVGETLKATAIKALGRILHIIYEDTNELNVNRSYNTKEFRKLLENQNSEELPSEPCLLEGKKCSKEKLEAHLNSMQNKGRSSQWYKETSIRIGGIFKEILILRSHISVKVRRELANMCAVLIENCARNLHKNFLILLENLIAQAEDENEEISLLCENVLKNLQTNSNNLEIFDESADTLFERHVTQLMQILQRKYEPELYAELLFIKGFLRNVNNQKLYALYSLTSFMESFSLALLTAVDLAAPYDLLNEEYALRQINESEFSLYAKLQWRQFKYLETERLIGLVEDICGLLGKTNQVNNLLFDHFLCLLQSHTQRMNEVLLILMWMFAASKEKSKSHKKCKVDKTRTKYVDLILTEILNDIHWQLVLEPDAVSHLKVNKASNWYVDRTPGLYESGFEMRIQDYDSDDEHIEDIDEHVGILDAQHNVLHTCIVLDTIGHFAKSLGTAFQKYCFRSLHKVLLKVASSNTMVYKAGMFALISMQEALAFENTSKFIESHTDYISYHLNMLLRRSPDSSAAVDILSVVLQLSTKKTLPHLELIFETIREECSKTNQSENISAYLRVFNAFLINVGRWMSENEMQVESLQIIDKEMFLEADSLLQNWLKVLEKPKYTENEDVPMQENNENKKKVNNDEANSDVNNENDDDTNSKKPELPRHIEITKQILQQTLKFLSKANQVHQIQSLECLIVGMPLLKDYEDDLLPLVHLVWQPLMEKFRQKDPLVLNRCFTMLNVLSTHAKGFILKRSLDNVIPYLKTFLKDAAAKSAVEHSNAQTQMYKLQIKLLEEFSNLIVTMEIDGKYLHDITEVIVIYLSEKQPKEFQRNAIEFFQQLHTYNGPLMYLVAIKKYHLLEYKANVAKIMLNIGV